MVLQKIEQKVDPVVRQVHLLFGSFLLIALSLIDVVPFDSVVIEFISDVVEDVVFPRFEVHRVAVALGVYHFYRKLLPINCFGDFILFNSLGTGILETIRLERFRL